MPLPMDVSKSKTPLVVATVKFLKEFIPKTNHLQRARAKLSIVQTVATATRRTA
ncbi:hypothetical protein JVT61DRAFT_10363 [Boletus reticuloceps]|uniref:Uncharacterized protein n=1 Tax=Boletus reticuloceps TaxID=495285 RepID=A0A8I3AC11_9AGAM|nr:hypothetical protein JVT61DRAFT_10363 [Boletus reticuloceps]